MSDRLLKARTPLYVGGNSSDMVLRLSTQIKRCGVQTLQCFARTRTKKRFLVSEICTKKRPHIACRSLRHRAYTMFQLPNRSNHSNSDKQSYDVV